jgi:Lysophospholipase
VAIDDATRAPAPRDEAGDRARARALDERLGDVDWSILPAGARRGWFDAPSGRLAMLSFGDPAHERVVLVPGITGSKEDFALVAPLLAAHGYLVQSYDLAGQYESADAGPPAGSHYDYELFERDLSAVLEAGGPAHLLGYSFAGIVAQAVTVSRPGLVRSLTLLTTPPDPGQAFRTVRWIGPLSWLASGHRGAGLMVWGIVTNKNRVPPGRLRFVRDRFALTRRSSVDDVIALMKRTPDLRAALRATGVGILVATGMHDLWPVRRHARFASRIGARLAVYRTGHSPCETAPHQLALDMLQLFDRARPPAS